MMRRTLTLFLALLLCCTGISASGKVLVREFSGTGSMTTGTFEVRAPWILDWRVNSDYQDSMAIEVALVDGTTGFHDGLVLKTKYAGTGVRLFEKSGRYRFRVSTTLVRWTLKVEQLTRAEAELYAPM